MTVIFAVPVLAFLYLTETAMPHGAHMANRALPAVVAVVLIAGFGAWRKRRATTASSSQRRTYTTWR